MKNLKKFDTFLNEDIDTDVIPTFGKPMTIKELIAKLQMIVSDDDFNVNEDDYVFLSLPDEDPGDADSLQPLGSITGDAVEFLKEESDTLNRILKKEAAVLIFVSPNTRD